MEFLKKSLGIIGSERRKIPLLVTLFMSVAILDLIGIGLVGPYIALIVDESVRDRFVLLIRNFVPFAVDEQSFVILASILLVLVSMFRMIAGIGCNAAIVIFAELQRFRVKLRLIKMYQDMPQELATARNSADYAQIVNVVTGHYTGNVLYYLLRMASDSIILLAILCLLAYQNIWILGLLVTVFVIVAGGFDVLVKDRLDALGRERNRVDMDSLQRVREMLDGIKEIRIFGKKDQFLRSFEMLANKTRKILIFGSVVSSMPRYLLEFCALFSIGLGGVLAFITVKNPIEVVPLLAVFGVAALRAIPIIGSIANSLAIIRANKNSVDLLVEQLEELADPVAQSHDMSIKDAEEFRELKIRNANFSYDNGNTPVLRNLSLDLKAGQSIGIVGESGVGKSTLLDLILGIIEPSSGTIMVNGRNIAENKNDWQSRIAVIPQQIFLLDADIRTNITLNVYDGMADAARLNEAIEVAALKEFVQSLRDGVKTRVGEGGASLSGGQRQRIAIARAFYHKREVIVLDEATSALDGETEEKVLAALFKVDQRLTAIFVTHKISKAFICSAIYEIKNGSLSLRPNSQSS